MERHDSEMVLHAMYRHAREAVKLCTGKTRADLDADRLLNLALARLVEIIAKAAGDVPETIQEKFIEIPWLQLERVRERLVESYDGVDYDILWAIVVHDLPDVITELEDEVGKIEREE